jgi:hypothetical protein
MTAVTHFLILVLVLLRGLINYGAALSHRAMNLAPRYIISLGISNDGNAVQREIYVASALGFVSDCDYVQ